MERRTFITATAGLLAATAGCVGGAPETPDDGPATTATPTPAAPAITARSLEPREQCDQAGGATISAADGAVTVDGCIVGKNGCMVPALESATYDADADELTVRVVTEDQSDEDEMCTQQIVHRGYRVTVEFAGGLPGTTTVIHDGAEGEREAGQADTSA